MIPDMNEFVLWPNCSGSCRFCWYKKLKSSSDYLTVEEKKKSLQLAIERISELSYTDVLFVGGELLEESNLPIKEDLFDAFTFVKNAPQIRFFYLNTNLMYKDTQLVDMLCEIFKDKPEKLRLATSYDVSGRFRSLEEHDRFLKNLKHITSEFNLNVVVNTILTKSICTGDFNVKSFCDKTGAYYVHLLPYLPISDDDPERPTFGEFANKLILTDKEIPGYLKGYLENLELPQEKYVWEFCKETQSFIDKAAKKASCGHNVNFRAILGGECFACELKKLYQDINL